MEHMKEPWSYAADHDEPEVCIDWNVFDSQGQLVFVASEANARRIVACVNACAGISEEALNAIEKCPDNNDSNFIG